MTELEQVFVSAVRYGIGRRTYITGVIVDFMIGQELGKQCKAIMIRDISEAEIRDELGDDCDKKNWIKLLTHLKK